MEPTYQEFRDANIYNIDELISRTGINNHNLKYALFNFLRNNRIELVEKIINSNKIFSTFVFEKMCMVPNIPIKLLEKYRKVIKEHINDEMYIFVINNALTFACQLEFKKNRKIIEYLISLGADLEILNKSKKCKKCKNAYLKFIAQKKTLENVLNDPRRPHLAEQAIKNYNLKRKTIDELIAQQNRRITRTNPSNEGIIAQIKSKYKPDYLVNKPASPLPNEVISKITEFLYGTKKSKRPKRSKKKSRK